MQSLASALAISSSRRSAEEGGVTGASAVLNSVSSPQRLASWASFPLAYVREAPGRAELVPQKALLETVVLARLRPPLYVGTWWIAARARACVTFREAPLPCQMYVYANPSVFGATVRLLVNPSQSKLSTLNCVAPCITYRVKRGKMKHNSRLQFCRRTVNKL